MLPTGARLGRYEVQSPLGAGGMGEVYRARDTELHRDVAIKVLPQPFAADADRLARLKREAQVLASLNHPNIAAIYGIEEADGVRALILELVEGPTLADRIAQGPVPLDEVIPIARQIADALEFAHDQGVIHRDLKPANVKLRPDGTVKVLDFGLAKALDPIAPTAAISQAPTITSPAMTGMGIMLGTATYMAPEQARGRAVDRRADIWAFGCVLFEMLSGRRAFEGDDVAETIGAVIHKEPDWNLLPATTPSYLRTLLRRCLQKDPKKRLPHIGIARIEFDEGPAGATAVRTEGVTSSLWVWSSPRIAWLVAGAMVLASMAFGVSRYLAPEPIDPIVTRASILPPPGTVWVGVAPPARVALSPDGLRIAFIAVERGVPRLWVRAVDATTAQPLPGTEGAVNAAWSPDSQVLAFISEGRLRKIDASGGPPITLAEKAEAGGIAWSGDIILFTRGGPAAVFFRTSPSGTTASQVTALGASDYMRHGSPAFLPDGRHFLFGAERRSPDGPGVDLYIGSVEMGEEPRLLLQGVPNAQYGAGYLLFMRDETLMAQPFDRERLELSGEAVPIAEGVQVAPNSRTGAFSVSSVGTLTYQTGSAEIESRLTWYDRAGRQIGTLGDPGDQMSVELSPDGSRALISMFDPATRGRDLWIVDVNRGVRTRFTFDPALENMGVWSPDGSRVAFNSSRRQGFFDLYQKASNGSGADEPVVVDNQAKEPHGWSNDGRTLIYSGIGGRTLRDVWTSDVAGNPKPAVFLQTQFAEGRPKISPDGRWVAYASNESGRSEIYVTTFPDHVGKWQVSTAGGDYPRWRRDGKEIFYVAQDNALSAASVLLDKDAVQIGDVQRLFEIRPRETGARAGQVGYVYDVSADGQRFLVNTLVEETSTQPITILVNWPALLSR